MVIVVVLLARFIALVIYLLHHIKCTKRDYCKRERV